MICLQVFLFRNSIIYFDVPPAENELMAAKTFSYLLACVPSYTCRDPFFGKAKGAIDGQIDKFATFP